MKGKFFTLLWYGHVLRREEENVLLNSLQFELLDRRGRGQPKQLWKKQVENKCKKEVKSMTM